MAAITPAKPNFYDVTSKAKVRVWTNPVIGANATGDTLTIPGIKRVFSITNAQTGVVVFTQATGGAGAVVTMTVTAASTGDYNPITVYGQ